MICLAHFLLNETDCQVSLATNGYYFDTLKTRKHFHKNLKLISLKNGLYGPEEREKLKAMESNIDELVKDLPSLLEKEKYDFVVTEFFLASAIPIVQSFGIKPIMYSSTGIFLVKMYLEDPVIGKPTKLDAVETTEEVDKPEAPFEREDAKKFFARIVKEFRDYFPLCTNLIMNSFEKLESDFYDIYNKGLKDELKDLKVDFVGPISNVVKDEDVKQEAPQELQEFLDSKEEESVLYVSMGSEFAMTDEQAVEMYDALTSLNLNFVWSIKKDNLKLLPAGYSDYKNGVFLDWVPQLFVLRHPATYGYLSHMGWNSSIESISNGIPLLSWPQAAEQHRNADAFVEKEVAVLVPNTSFHGRVVPSLEIQEHLKIFLEKKDILKKNALLLKEAAEENSKVGSEILKKLFTKK
ncbi:hypothetical protein HDU92_003340 [Lobulomyces angularis]|nr:hypothetical protein HDU92_003340 [Lobulomyces angularis]